jgi:hypothetical protein
MHSADAFSMREVVNDLKARRAEFLDLVVDPGGGGHDPAGSGVQAEDDERGR